MASEFNAIDYAAELESTGVPKEQAAVHASALTKVLGSYALGRELDALRMELRAQFESFKTEFNAKLMALEISLKADIKIVKSEVKQLRWIMGISVGFQIAILLKLIFP